MDCKIEYKRVCDSGVCYVLSVRLYVKRAYGYTCV